MSWQAIAVCMVISALAGAVAVIVLTCCACGAELADRVERWIEDEKI